MVSGQVKPSDASPTKSTTIGSGQLSASSVMSSGSATGTSAEHSTVMLAGAVPVGAVISSTVII